jgi:type VI secretion system VasD/TssJ family lipoprotein
LTPKQQQNHQLLKYLIGVLSVYSLCICGCSRHATIFVQAANDLNNGGNPVVVRIYQLSTDVNFRSQSSEAFWSGKQSAFRNDVLGEMKEIILHPREILKLKKVKIHKKAMFIGVAADFYDPHKEQWFYLYDVKKYKSKKILIAVRKNSLAVSEVTED